MAAGVLMGALASDKAMLLPKPHWKSIGIPGWDAAMPSHLNLLGWCSWLQHSRGWHYEAYNRNVKNQWSCIINHYHAWSIVGILHPPTSWWINQPTSFIHQHRITCNYIVIIRINYLYIIIYIYIILIFIYTIKLTSTNINQLAYLYSSLWIK
jgi:hypothetical protein